MAETYVKILGDSISGGYAPHLGARLPAHFHIEQVYAGDSAQLLAGLPGWLAGKQPALIVFNCGLHDVRIHRERLTFQQPLSRYVENLTHIVSWLRDHAIVQLLWATTTPVMTERIPLENSLRTNEAIQTYNRAAQEVMRKAGVPIVDLYASLMGDTLADCILDDDGVHMTERGNRILARAIAYAIQSLIS